MRVRDWMLVVLVVACCMVPLPDNPNKRIGELERGIKEFEQAARETKFPVLRKWFLEKIREMQQELEKLK